MKHPTAAGAGAPSKALRRVLAAGGGAVLAGVMVAVLVLAGVGEPLILGGIVVAGAAAGALFGDRGVLAVARMVDWFG